MVLGKLRVLFLTTEILPLVLLEDVSRGFGQSCLHAECLVCSHLSIFFFLEGEKLSTTLRLFIKRLRIICLITDVGEREGEGVAVHLDKVPLREGNIVSHMGSQLPIRKAFNGSSSP